MKRTLVIVLASLLLAGALLAQARPSRGAGAAQQYVVRPGDTLWSIAAARYAGDPRRGVWEIEHRNGLHGAALVPGQRLVLPAP